MYDVFFSVLITICDFRFCFVLNAVDWLQIKYSVVYCNDSNAYLLLSFCDIDSN